MRNVWSNKTPCLRPVLGLLLLSGSIESLAAQSGTLPAEQAESFRRRTVEAEARGLAEPFRGATRDGRVIPDLFAIRSTGVSTAPVREAAAAFLASLSPGQRAKATFRVDDVEWRKWMNTHFYVRQGVSFGEMTAAQRRAAVGLLQASLSAKGLRQTRDIMRLNTTMAELSGKPAEYGEGLYYFTMMGEPSASEPWGWQLDGHHLIINYFVLGDQVIMTPTFMAQRDRLMDLVSEHVRNLRDGHAAVRLDEVRRHLDETYFAWIGGTDANSVFYYRVHSPVVLIEFDHQGPIGLPGDRNTPTRNHIHSIVRTPNGNDYGKDLLRQHYERHPHPHRH